MLNCDLVWVNKEPYFRVESLSGAGRVTFEVLRARLIQQVKVRINNGEFTERGLARLLDISQSQTHNVLKGARKLQMHLADRILTRLGISAVDLLNDGELDAALRRKMTDWDREIAAAGESDLANTGTGARGVVCHKTASGAQRNEHRPECAEDRLVRRTEGRFPIAPRQAECLPHQGNRTWKNVETPGAT